MIAGIQSASSNSRAVNHTGRRGAGRHQSQPPVNKGGSRDDPLPGNGGLVLDPTPPLAPRASFSFFLSPQFASEVPAGDAEPDLSGLPSFEEVCRAVLRGWVREWVHAWVGVWVRGCVSRLHGGAPSCPRVLVSSCPRVLVFSCV